MTDTPWLDWFLSLHRAGPAEPEEPCDPCGNPPIQAPGFTEATRASAITTAIILMAGGQT